MAIVGNIGDVAKNTDEIEKNTDGIANNMDQMKCPWSATSSTRMANAEALSQGIR